ncbi:MAG: hypothetical protein ACFCUG_14745 [Thiotrichales bacterium]
MKMPLRQAVRQHLNSQHLSESHLERLQQLTPSRPPVSRRMAWSRAAFASVLLLAVSISLSFLWQNHKVDNIAQRIAEEVALNHLKLKPLDIEADQISALAAYFTRLDFAVRDSSLITETGGMRLLGGRYCSVLAAPAAQLHLQRAEGEVLTLYEAAYDPQTFHNLPNLDQGEQPLVLYARGIRVAIWIEKGLLFALAGE